MKSLITIFNAMFWVGCSTVASAQNIGLTCTYTVDGQGKHKDMSSSSVEQNLHISTDNGSYLTKMSMTLDEQENEIVLNYKHPSEYEKSTDRIKVEVTDTKILIKGLKPIDTSGLMARAELHISRQTGRVFGNWVLNWYNEGTVNDLHKLEGSCKKFEQLF